ncbi:MAG TPA: hypothetical protein PKM78_08550, partial [Anaerolineae bacterium]|nr:hypothetical protein [Anaerolineae bacterium]
LAQEFFAARAFGDHVDLPDCSLHRLFLSIAHPDRVRYDGHHISRGFCETPRGSRRPLRAGAALPETGQPSMERWLTSADRDVRWIMRQNLSKQRLVRMDAGWVTARLAQIAE